MVKLFTSHIHVGSLYDKKPVRNGAEFSLG